MKTKNHFLGNIFSRKRSISILDISLFFRQFATLLTAGIPILTVCMMLEKCYREPFRTLISSIKKSLLTGKTLSYSLANFPIYFNQFLCQLVEMGEKMGRLDSVLTTIATYQEKELHLKKQIKQALFYPGIILTMAFLVTIVMFLFVIPKFAILFADIKDKLPLLTRCIFYLSEKFNAYCGILFLIFILIILIAVIFKDRISLKEKLYSTLSCAPYIKLHFQKIILIRFARNLALTLTSGLPITNALNLSARAAGNKKFETITDRISEKVNSGLPLYYGMQLFSFFPELFVQMVKIGEESGRLEFMLNKVAELFETDIDQSMQYFSQFLEPLIMVLLGVLIGGLILGMYLPIFKLGNTL